MAVLYVPAAHAVQVLAVPVIEEYVPIGHGEQDNAPTGIHADAPVPEKKPV